MKGHRLFTLSPIKITVLYLLFGVTWIGTTDTLVATLFQSPDTITTLQTVKGWVFVLLSGLLIYGLTAVRHRQVEDSQEQLQTATQQLQVFNRVFRHNMRNDLNVVRGNIELAIDRVFDSGDGESLQKAKQKTNTIISMSEKLRIVDSLEVDDTDAAVDLTAIASDAIDTVRQENPDVEISTSFPDDASVYGDYTIYRALIEVLENAIVHNPNEAENCAVSVEISRTNGAFELLIRDNGQSIPTNELASIRAESESELVHMSGVGLWLVKWVCECHGGEVEFETDTCEGTAVRLTFQRVEQYPVPAVVDRLTTGDEKLPASA